VADHRVGRAAHGRQIPDHRRSAAGALLVISAVNEVALAQVVTGGWKFLHYAISVAFVLAALWAFIRPINIDAARESASAIPAQQSHTSERAGHSGQPA
jgi:hypothetical protein